jgi:hypothetical protein
MVWRKVNNDDEGEAAVGGYGLKKYLEHRQSPGRYADSNNGWPPFRWRVGIFRIHGLHPF